MIVFTITDYVTTRGREQLATCEFGGKACEVYGIHQYQRRAVVIRVPGQGRADPQPAAFVGLSTQRKFSFRR
jgi:hypothetical protein